VELVWTPELAERTAHAACRARDLAAPTDFIRFSEAAVFRSGDVAVRVDQGFTDRLTGDRTRRMVDYMHNLGVSTIPTAGIPTFMSDDGLNVTFYEFVAEGEAPHWEQTLRGVGEQIRRIHDLGEIHFLEEIVHPNHVLNYAQRKTSHIVGKLEAFKENSELSSLSGAQVNFLHRRALEVQEQIFSSDEGGELEKVLIHGDAHLGNSTTAKGRVLIFDFEEVGVGARFIDHLHMLLADRMFNVPLTYQHFAAGYGQDFSRTDGIDAWLELVAYIYIVWAAGLGVVSEKHRFETQERFRFWEADLHKKGISKVDKEDMPYLWNMHM
jgi:thiamine kinase-like enzyme